MIIFHCFVYDTGYEIPLVKGHPGGIRKCTIILPKKASVQTWTKNVWNERFRIGSCNKKKPPSRMVPGSLPLAWLFELHILPLDPHHHIANPKQTWPPKATKIFFGMITDWTAIASLVAYPPNPAMCSPPTNMQVHQAMDQAVCLLQVDPTPFKQSVAETMFCWK